MASATMVLIGGLLVWAPIPLASNRPWSWSLLALWAALALLVWASAAMLGAWSRARAALPVALATLTTVPVWAWAYVQTMPAATFAWLAPHPLWAPVIAAGLGDAVPLVGLDAAGGGDALMRLMSYAAVFWLAWWLAQDAVRARFLLAVILVTTTVCAAYGLLDHLAGWETIGWLAKTAYIGDVTGTFVNRNNFATYANLGVIVGLGLLAEPLLAMRHRYAARRMAARAVTELIGRRWPILLALAILTTASLRSHSRGGMLSLALTLAILMLLMLSLARPRWPVVLAVIAGAVMLGWGLLGISGGGTLERIGRIDDNYDIDVAGRLTYWQVSLAMVADCPWQGHGYGNFEAAFAQYRDERFTDRVDMAHNTYIEHLVELGVPATVLLYLGPLILFGYCLRGLFVRRRNQLMPLVAVGATVLVALHTLVDFSLQIPAVAVTYAALLAIGVAQASPRSVPA